MPTFDFSSTLKHRTGQPFTTNSVGLGTIANLWAHEQDYDKPLQMGSLFELVLLYTIDRRVQQRPPPNNMLSEEEKRDRYALSLKIRDNGTDVEINMRELELLKMAISVFPVEPNVLCHQFLETPKV